MPLEIADEDIAPAKALKIPLAILLSNIKEIFSLPIFFGLSFLIVSSAADFPNASASLISLR